MTKYKVQIDPGYTSLPSKPTEVEAEGYVTDDNWLTFNSDGKPVAMFSARSVVSVTVG